MSLKVTLPAQEMTVEALEALIAEAKAKQAPPFPFPPRFQVGDWTIERDGPMEGARQVTRVVGEMIYHLVGSHDLWSCAHLLRHATPDEIAAATRINLKAKMLLQRKSDGAVFRLRDTFGLATRLDVDYEFVCRLFDVSTLTYDVLDSYAIQGAK